MSDATKVKTQKIPGADVAPARSLAPRLPHATLQPVTEPPATAQRSPAQEIMPLGSGHDFGQIRVQPAAKSCPLSLTAPRACPFGGICHACPAHVQAKLTVSQPGDKYEEEADRVADMVMSMPKPCPECKEKPEDVQTKPVADQITPLVQRQVEPEKDEEEEEEEAVQPKSLMHQPATVQPALVTRIQALRGGGQPLSESTRAFFEPRFGRRLGHVRVHACAQAAETARLLNARAYSIGRDVVFGSGEYAPETTSGRILLAHELAHVLQQTSVSTLSSSKRDAPQYETLVQRRSRLVNRTPVATVRKVRVVVTRDKDGTALIAPYDSRTNRLYTRAIYEVPTYRMTIAGTTSSEEQAFKVVRFGMMTRYPEPSLPAETRRCDCGRTELSKDWTPTWNATYRPHSCSKAGGRSGAWHLEGNRYLHEGPSPDCPVFGSTGCIEVAGQGEWNRFLARIESLSGANCEIVGKKRALRVELQPAPRPLGHLAWETL